PACSSASASNATPLANHVRSSCCPGGSASDQCAPRSGACCATSCATQWWIRPIWPSRSVTDQSGHEGTRAARPATPAASASAARSPRIASTYWPCLMGRSAHSVAPGREQRCVAEHLDLLDRNPAPHEQQQIARGAARAGVGFRVLMRDDRAVGLEAREPLAL